MDRACTRKAASLDRSEVLQSKGDRAKAQQVDHLGLVSTRLRATGESECEGMGVGAAENALRMGDDKTTTKKR